MVKDFFGLESSNNDATPANQDTHPMKSAMPAGSVEVYVDDANERAGILLYTEDGEPLASATLELEDIKVFAEKFTALYRHYTEDHKHE